MATSTDSAHELYRRWLDEVWNGSADRVGALVTDDFVGHWPDRDVRGARELAGQVEAGRAMFAELRFVCAVGPLVDGDMVAARWTGVGRTADGEERRFAGHDIFRLRDGRFAEYWVATVEQ